MTLWAPVVYGRTAASDTWWQAVPDGLTDGGWLGTVVHSAYFRARELRERPRFLLAQNQSRRIVGVACRAATLDATMGSDGHRELFCFVGWVAERSADATPAAPRFEDLNRDYAHWAGSVYTRLMAPIWHEPPARNSGPRATLPEEVRWPAATGNGHGQQIDDGVWPEASWPALWDALQTAAEPFTCVIGWQHMTTARFEDATHIGVADAPARPLPAPAHPVTASRVKPGIAPRSSEPVDAGGAVVPTPSGTAPGKAAIGPGPRPRRSRVLVPGQLATAAAVGAVIAGAAVAALMPARTAPAPKPERVTVTVTATAQPPASSGPPASLTLNLQATDSKTSDDVIAYGNGRLFPGAATARMAEFPSPAPPSAGACARLLTQAPGPVPVKPLLGLRICVELKGTPARYGLIEVTAISSSVSATATFWP